MSRQMAKEVTQRQRRVAELLRRVISEILAEGIRLEEGDPEMSITVGEVRLSPDLRKATVYVMPLGGERAEEAVAMLNRERVAIRKQVGRGIRMKHSPTLRFVHDPLFDQMDALRQLFDREEVRRDVASAADPEGR